MLRHKSSVQTETGATRPPSTVSPFKGITLSGGGVGALPEAGGT